MPRRLIAAMPALGTIALLGITSCESTAPGTGGGAGGLALVTTTAGIQPDSDGYTIIVDGTPHGTIGPNDSVNVSGIDHGSHAVELADIEFNCATLGQFTRTVPVAADAESVVDYSVACDALSRSRIGFVRDRDYSSAEVFVMNADGSDVTSLEDSVGAVNQRGSAMPPVSWSADGTRMAFTRADGGLYATTGEGAEVVQLAPVGMSPIWSADGQAVAFLAADAGTVMCCWNIFLAKSDGSGVRRVTEGFTILRYDFAANGSFLAYEGNSGDGFGVFVVRADGTGQRVVMAPGISEPQMPSLSPDGTRLAYYAYPDLQDENGPGWEIFVSPTEGDGPAIAVSNNPGDDWWPVWSPDGTRIAFVSSSSGSFGPGSLRVVNADGSGQLDLTPTDNVWEPIWSPDGARVAYSGGSHIFVANADGSGRTEITPDWDTSRPTWTGR